jgi:hypothetical protein
VYLVATTFVAALAALTISTPAAAQEGFRTTPNGSPLRWRQESNVRITFDASLLAIDERAIEVSKTGLSAWLTEDAGQPTLSFSETTKGTVGYTSGASCTVVYKPEGDPIAGNALAITITTYDENTGTIYDADILVNGGPQRRFALLEGKGEGEGQAGPGDQPGAAAPATARTPERDVYDLQNVLTHEGGHFFGLADFPNAPAATMYPITAWGELDKRTLDTDDVNSLRALYATSDEVDPPGGCGGNGASVGGGAGHRAAWLLAFACGLIAAARRFPRFARWAAPPLALALLAIGALGAPAAAGPFAAIRRAGASARVASVRLLRDGPVLRSEVELTAPRCRGARCADAMPRRATLPGGSDGAIAQRVGHTPPAHLGDAIAVDAPRVVRWVEALSPALSPLQGKRATARR